MLQSNRWSAGQTWYSNIMDRSWSQVGNAKKPHSKVSKSKLSALVALYFWPLLVGSLGCGSKHTNINCHSLSNARTYFCRENITPLSTTGQISLQAEILSWSNWQIADWPDEGRPPIYSTMLRKTLSALLGLCLETWRYMDVELHQRKTKWHVLNEGCP